MKTMNVEILMSSYNGEKYIAAQIESILAQENVNIHLTIRDDGSKDNTVAVIEKYQKAYPDKIQVIQGSNVGYRKSFLLLLEYAKEANYYGFSDQDDVWKKTKIKRAVDCLNTMGEDIKLYASNIELVNEKLERIGFNDFSNMLKTLESYFTRARLPGCTFVFSPKLKELAARFSELDLPAESMPDHDFVVGSCAFSCGTVYIDNECHILHIRRDGSVTGGGNGIVKRAKMEWKLLFRRKNVRSMMAKALLEKCDKELSMKNKKFLETVAFYKDSFANKTDLIKNTNMTSHMMICDLETKIKIFLSNY